MNDDGKAHLLFDYYLLVDFSLTMGSFAVPSPTNFPYSNALKIIMG